MIQHQAQACGYNGRRWKGHGSAPPDSHVHSHIVSACATNCGLTLAQPKVDEKSNEITAKILDKKADYIFTLKGNLSSMLGDARSLTMHERRVDTFEETDAGRGREEC